MNGHVHTADVSRVIDASPVVAASGVAPVSVVQVSVHVHTAAVGDIADVAVLL